MPKGPNSDDVNDDVTDDATDDVTDDVADDATDSDATDDDASDTDQDGSQDDAPQDQGGKPKSKTRQPPTRQTPDPDDPTAGLKKALIAERQRARQLDKDLKELQRKHATAEERQLMEAKEQAATEAAAAVKGPLIKALAASELKAANVQGTNIPKLVRLLDLDKVEVNDGGGLDGLEDQIEELKEEFPNLFAAATGSATKVPNVNGGTGNGRKKDQQDKQPPRGFAQQLADQVMAAVPPGQGMVSR